MADLRVRLGPVTLVGDHPDAANPLAPGQFRVEKSVVMVGTASTPVQLGQVQPPGKKAMAAADWLRGARLGDQVRAS